jgi:hypothetical protein
MSIANNVVIDQPGIVSTRRGFEYYSTYQFPITNGYITKLYSYENTLYALFNGGKLAYDSGAGAWVPYVNFTMLPPEDGFIHQMLAGGNSYFTTNNGPQVISGVNTTNPVVAGIPKALDGSATASSPLSSGFLNPQSQCAYQIVWGYTDNSNLEKVGAPSQSIFLSNTNSGAGNNVNSTLVFTIPPFIVQNSTLPWFYQIYRTPNTGSLTVPPGNNFQLVYQGNPASGDYTNHYVSFTDTVLDSLLTDDLYTDDGQPDAGNPYNPPPLCYDMAFYNNMAFFANFTTIQNVFFTLDSVGSPSGLQVGDTVSFTDSTSATTYTYTGVSGSNNPTLRHFQIVTGGTAASNIQATAQNLVTVLNRDPNNFLFTLQYVSGYAGLPGQMYMEAQNLSQAFFSITSSRITCWTPPLIPTSGTAYSSSAVSLQNTMFISQVGKPESVPPSFTFPVGSVNFPIQRIIALRTALFVIKPEEGIFMVTGTSPTSLSVTPIDTTAFIKGSETLAPLNNSGFFFSTQAGLSVNESGAEIVSRNVERDLLALSAYTYPNFSELAFAVGYQSDRAWILFLQANPSDLWSTLQYRYNWITQTWTTWNKPCTAAIVNPADDRLYIATPTGHILQERKTDTDKDYADESTVVDILSIGTLSFTLSDSTSVNIDDVIIQTVGGNSVQCQVTGNDELTGVVTVTTVAGFVTGTAVDYASINTNITYMPLTASYPAFLKKFTTWQFLFSDANFAKCSVNFTSDFYPNSETVTLVPKTAGGWGTSPWGSTPWGLSTIPLQTISTYATKNTSVAHWVVVNLNLTQAFTSFSLDGLAVFYTFAGERFK